jgi:hypothetical protein
MSGRHDEFLAFCAASGKSLWDTYCLHMRDMEADHACFLVTLEGTVWHRGDRQTFSRGGAVALRLRDLVFGKGGTQEPLRLCASAGEKIHADYLLRRRILSVIQWTSEILPLHLQLK